MATAKKAAPKKAAAKKTDAPKQAPVVDPTAAVKPYKEENAVSDTPPVGAVHENVKAAAKAAAKEAKDAAVEPGAVMASAPEGYATGAGDHWVGDHVASHGDGSKFAKEEAKRVKEAADK